MNGKSLKRIGYTLAALAILFGSMAGYSVIHPHHARAQYGATAPFGAVLSTNLFPPASVTGAAGTVTNTSAFLMQVDGGPVYCNGNQSAMAESNITLQANTTFLIVYNCPQETLYAKRAVVGPGTLSPDQPGVPATLLYATPGLEVALAQVVCGAATCATITDQRSATNFPSGSVQAGSVTFANLPATFPNGAALYCSTCAVATSPCTGASTGAMALRVNGAWRCQ